MSSSNVIKQHRLRPTAIVVGPRYPRRHEPPADDGVGASSSSEALVPYAGMDKVNEILDKARRAAEDIVGSAAARAEEVEKEAYETGFQKGYGDGLEAGRAEEEVQIKHLTELVQAAVIDRSSLLRSSESELVQLALEIAEKVVHKQLVEDEALVMSLVKGALEYLDTLDVLRIRVNPRDVDVLQAHWDELGFGHSGQNIELIPDLKVQAGGCIIDTKSAVVDAQLETKLMEIERAFRAQLDTDRKR